jgi:predicted O-methyltransferase YrrM
MRNAMEMIAPRDLEYLDRLHPKLDGVLARIDEEGGRERIPVVGTAVGRCLRVLVAAARARRVLEIGTAIGYSLLWMGAALAEDGELVTIDPDRARTARAEASWREAGIRARLRIENAPALEVLPRLRGDFDLAFIDAIKTEYEAYLEGVLPLLRDGGTVCVDNLLWQGKASGSREADDPDTRAIRAFNERFVRHPRLFATIVPVGDGLGIGVKRPA